MSNDIYEDLTDEEKALLKREIKQRIENQRAQEKAQKNAPEILFGMGLLFTFVMFVHYLIFASQRPGIYGYLPFGLTWGMLCLMAAPGAFFFLIAFVNWRKRRNENFEDPTVKTKNKRE